MIYERHRHRYEVNNFLRRRLEAAGLVVSGTTPDERLVEIIELPDHPFFVASQFHPEFKSRPERPAPLFREFVGAAQRYAQQRRPQELPEPGDPIRAGRPEERGARALHEPTGRFQHARDVRPASEAEKARLNEQFAALCRIPSPFGPGGRGRRARDAASSRASASPSRPTRAATCSPASAGARSGPSCCARTSTPSRCTARSSPSSSTAGWENAHDTILGADNKAAVAVLLEVARRASVEGAPVGIELLFTVAEEDGLAGAKAFDAVRAARRLRLRLRPRHADRRGRRRLADVLPPQRRVPRPRRARRDPARGGPQRDPRRGARDRRDAARPHRRADDGQRRLDPRRQRLHQRRARALPAPGRGALARPGARRGRRRAR